ncbi:MAG: hypothetical protein R3C44_03170 [Chloroflexota bacterium]
MGAVYILFLVGVFMLRKLLPAPPADGEWWSPVVRGILAAIFGLLLTTALAWQLGFFESLPSADPRVLGEGEAAAYFVFAPGAWLGVSMLYILFLAFPVNETIPESKGQFLAYALFGLITPALMLVAMAAQGQVMLPGTNPILWFIGAVITLLIMFIPPRLLYASRVFPIPGQAATLSLISLSVVILITAWRVVGG